MLETADRAVSEDGLFTVAAVLIRTLAGWALDAYGRRLPLLGGLLLFALLALRHNRATAIMVLLGMLFLHGLSFGVSTVACDTMVSDLVPKTRLSEGTGYLAVTWSLSLAIGPVLGLTLVERGHYGPLFIANYSLALSFNSLYALDRQVRTSASSSGRWTLTSPLGPLAVGEWRGAHDLPPLWGAAPLTKA